MRKSLHRLCYASVFLGSMLVACFLLDSWVASAAENSLQDGTPKPLAQPPKDQKYIGSKQCSSCHFDQFLDWRSTKHAKAFEALPAKYKTDASCLKCHTTGHGEESGFKDATTTAGLVGISCETCHGPGSKHGEIATSFGKKKLSKDEEAYVRSTIHKIQPKNVCVDCHLTRAHKKHPAYDK